MHDWTRTVWEQGCTPVSGKLGDLCIQAPCSERPAGPHDCVRTAGIKNTFNDVPLAAKFKGCFPERQVGYHHHGSLNYCTSAAARHCDVSMFVGLVCVIALCSMRHVAACHAYSHTRSASPFCMQPSSNHAIFWGHCHGTSHGLYAIV